jgi:hypothetical protein
MYLGPIELICTSQFPIAIEMKILPSKFWPDTKSCPKVSGNSAIDALQRAEAEFDKSEPKYCVPGTEKNDYFA